jgi:putative membrane protein
MIDKLIIIAKGIAMGAADVVPGVSGGTIALLTGIYPRLINAITGLNVSSIKNLFQGQFKQFWSAIDGCFVLPLLIGIATAFLLLAHPIKHAIQNHPIPMWSFFFGLIIASALLIIKTIDNKKVIQFLWLIPGIMMGYWIGSLTSIPFPSNNIAVLIAGMLAISAMILPGISGSFILVLLGMYEKLITAVADRDWATLLIFIGGAIVGLLVFSRIIKWVLNKFYNITLFFLSGLMLGSLVKVWPWKNINLQNIMPNNYEQPNTQTAIAMMIVAFLLVFTIEFFGKKLTTKLPTK